MREIAIETENLSKVYKLYEKPSDRVLEALKLTKKCKHKDYYALNHVSFKFYKGETIGIVGKNGSGKSTLLKMLTGVLTPTEGKLKVNGRISALLELGAGFNGEYTGIENIYLNGSIMGYTKEQMQQRVEEIVKFADIGDYINQPVKTYSSGMFVRLAFAVAINVDPDILIVDEALAVGDVRFQLKCMDKFLEFKQRGITIIYVSHDTNSIKRFCERALWINEGKLMDDGDVDIVTDRYLDYLKVLDAEKENYETNNEQTKNCDSEDMGNCDNIAELVNIRMYNSKGEEVQEVTYGTQVDIEIEYKVNDTTIKHPVLGIAILRVDNLYICGVNTLLDNENIPWEKGLNKYKLRYDKFNLVGGSYYFDVALYDQTASVPFDYRSKYKQFFVRMGYVAEGIVVLNHEWKDCEVLE